MPRRIFKGDSSRLLQHLRRKSAVCCQVLLQPAAYIPRHVFLLLGKGVFHLGLLLCHFLVLRKQSYLTLSRRHCGGWRVATAQNQDDLEQ